MTEGKFLFSNLCFICVHLWLKRIQLKIPAKNIFIAAHERLSAFSL